MDLIAEGFPIDELHCDKVSAVALADFINMRYVRMIEGCGRLCFADKAVHPIAIRSNLGRQNLQSNSAI